MREHDVARIVLIDEGGALLEGDALSALVGAAVTLRVRLTSKDAALDETYDLTLGDVLDGCEGDGGC